MKYFPGSGFGRTLLINLTRGDKVLESILEVLEKENIKNAAVVSGIGSLCKINTNWASAISDEITTEKMSLEKALEVSALQGVIIDSKAHLHITFSDLDHAYCGHLEHGTETLFLMEILVVELTGYNLTKVSNPNGILVFDEL